MPIRQEYIPSKAVVQFLVRCYRFVAWEWQRVEREQLPDEGFEQRFRESCHRELRDWSISAEREFHLGGGMDTASGVAHEVDIIARHPGLTAIMEMKNRSGELPGKNDVIVFFAKILDYLAANPMLVASEVCLAFMSRSSFDSRGIATCLGLGIHPVAPDLRPLPILIDNALRMQSELNQGLDTSSNLIERFDDFCAYLNQLSTELNDTWLDNRCGYLSENSISLRAIVPPEVDSLTQKLRQASSECAEILSAFQAAKTVGRE